MNFVECIQKANKSTLCLKAMSKFWHADSIRLHCSSLFWDFTKI